MGYLHMSSITLDSKKKCFGAIKRSIRKESRYSWQFLSKQGYCSDKFVLSDPVDVDFVNLDTFGLTKHRIKKNKRNGLPSLNEKYSQSRQTSTYTYEGLTRRIYDILKLFNPQLTCEKKINYIKPPQVIREGAKKTVFVNFEDICIALNRGLDNIKQFILAELGVFGSIDSSQRLLVKGRFEPRVFENLLRQYMIEYVVCESCKSFNTSLIRNQITRSMMVKCNRCGASKTVLAVKKGYQARTISRRVERAISM